MLERLTKKNERGFTLAELLVVVAIIAILVAVSIPIFTSQLEKSREATDKANARAAKAAATVAILDEDTDFTSTTTIWGGSATNGYTAYYDAEDGVLVKAKPVAYGKGTTSGDVNEDNAGKVVQVTITPGANIGEGTVSVDWV